MNLSGEAVAALMNFYKIPQEDLWIIYDDLDLPLGQLRIRKEGSAGTHNGMKSIIESIGKTDFPRFRVGIESRGETAPSQQDTSSFVLDSFNKQELKPALEGMRKAVAAVILALQKDLETAMNQYNG